jgi:tetratricopeptide (TPR) repeat protein
MSVSNPSAGVQSTTVDHAPAGAIGTVIAGKYQIVEEIGEGGMGTVFLAQQTEPVKRQVALKLVKAGMDSKAVLARFEAERQALAMMDHPNIARVLDGGATETGRPFFVMELVKGVPITRFCDQRKLSPRERLDLFVPVCQAIQHAHNKGIIHRDIKPSNVLVALFDDKPVPKVIDFGIAKATGGSLTDYTLVTGLGAMVGTPEYMSPEQAGFTPDVDTRSDVYALGVLLYELLTGTTPVDRARLGKAAVMEILRVIREEEPARPSTKLSTSDALPNIAANRNTEPAQLTRLLRGELDCVVMKALEKDRARRYETAAGLARDIQRYLADEVVEARPPSAGYRLRKFVQRNKGRVVAGMLVLLALVVGMIGTTVGMVQANAARRVAQDAQKEAETQTRLAEKRLLQSLDAVLLFARDARVYCEDAMVPGESRQKLYELLVGQLEKHVDDEDGAFDEDLARNKILMYQLIAQVHEDIGHYRESKEWREKGLKLADRWVAARPDDPAAASHRAVYVHLLGSTYEREGHRDRAKALYQEALQVRRKVLNDPRVDRFTSGKSYYELGESLDTAQLFDESLKLREEAYRKHRTFDLLGAWFSTYWQAGSRAREYEKKKANLSRAAELIAELAAQRPTSRSILSRWSSVLRDLGKLEYNHGNVAEAQKHYSQYVKFAQQLATSTAMRVQRQEYAGGWYRLGMIEKKLGHPEEARKHLERSRHVREELLLDYPNDSLLSHRRLDLLFAQVALGEHAKALAAADTIATSEPRENNPQYENVHYRLACLYALGIAAVEEARLPKPLTPEDKSLQSALRDKALKSLELTLANGNKNLDKIRVEADLVAVRGDPRYERLLAKYGER